MLLGVALCCLAGAVPVWGRRGSPGAAALLAVDLGGTLVAAPPSVGVHIADGTASAPGDLLREADAAMYTAKRDPTRNPVVTTSSAPAF